MLLRRSRGQGQTGVRRPLCHPTSKKKGQCRSGSKDKWLAHCRRRAGAFDDWARRMRDEYFSLNEVGGRTAYLFAGLIGDPLVAGGTAAMPYEIVLDDRTIAVSAADAFTLAPDERMAARRLVAAAERPMLWVRVHRPWDGLWSHDPVFTVVWCRPGALLASEMLAARMAIIGDHIWLVTEGRRQALRINADGWSAQPVPADDDEFAKGREAARMAWQDAVACPAGVK